MISQIGFGFVGSALNKSFSLKNKKVKIYDKYKNLGSINDIADSKICFFCLPTPFAKKAGFDKSAIIENLDKLESLAFKGLVVIKSTIEIGTTKNLSKKYSFDICHNPEFLTERTAFEDFHNQKHIVLGKTKDSDLFNSLTLLYKELYPDAKISVCTSDESEAMKLFCNNFYAAKVMIFNEFYFLCQKLDVDFDNTVSLMLQNNWINPMHTKVPGPDGQVGYGGNCFIKDTNALLEQMIRNDSFYKVFEAVVKQRDILRSDNNNMVDYKE